MTAKKTKHHQLLSLSLAALGVVYGDIGTSPLYAMRESLHGLPIDLTNILGILSLIFWTLAAVISVKYLIILLRADNDGEGGILALLALVRRVGGAKKISSLLFFIAILGAGLILGDGMLTPAISVLSAVEGLHIILPNSSPFILPIACVILLALFAVQSLGTAKIGFIFGPIILFWFMILALIGLPHIIENPIVLKAINPFYAYQFFHNVGWKGYTLLGGVFLVATGAEALYADLGHFGKTPIRFSWFTVALPALLLNYFGQGAYLLQQPEAITNPFYLSAPQWSWLSLLLLATIATIIASQAIISATFSLTKQAILLGLYPKLSIVQTSSSIVGQVYIPQMNIILCLGTLILVFTFKNASALTHAYGIAVNLNMILTTALALFVAMKQWRWHWLWVVFPFTFIGIADLAFLGANFQKLLTGGWVPVLFAGFSAFIMYTWQAGRAFLSKTYYMKEGELLNALNLFDNSIHHLPHTTAVFINDIYDKSGGTFLHFLKLYRSLPQNMIMINYSIENSPHIAPKDRFKIHLLKENICEMTIRYGFMDNISIPLAMYTAHDRGVLPFPIDIDNTIYLIEIPNILASRKKKSLLFYWQERLFAFLVRNYSANLNIEFYKLPFNHTIAIGTYYII